MSKYSSHYILTLSCRDGRGIVAAVASFLAQNGCNILDSAQYGDAGTNRFMMRVVFEPLEGSLDLQKLQREFRSVAEHFGMTEEWHDSQDRLRVAILVSKEDHCLNDLLYRHRIGALPIDPVAIISNHPDAGPWAAAHGIPFHHWPVTPETKAAQEEKLWNLIQAESVELVVLARYMQILSDELCKKLAGRAINIHHSFLPSFKGAKPYQQAYERGVKLIGATAHYVTGALDEGPIIEQEVARVDYKMSAADLAATGRDVECMVLSKAVKYHIERRVFLNGQKTVVFR